VDDPFARGAGLFDAGSFFEAHEAWEERWKVATDPAERRFLQGLIQIAAAFHKLFAMRSSEAASRLLARGLAKLEASPALVAERGLAGFCSQARACEQALAAGPLAPEAVPRIGATAAKGM
jgi:predicted metal-dependent hydrolase